MSLPSDFRAAWWLSNPHLQSIWGKVIRSVPEAQDRLERWGMPDGDSVTVALVEPRSTGAPMLAVFHGLEGSTRSVYARALLHQARARGWGAAQLVWRSCDDRIPERPRLYHSGETGDAAHFIALLGERYPGRPFYLVGVSLGANVMLKWLGEAPERVPPRIRAAAAVSTPFDLASGSRFLERGFSRVYTRFFVHSLRRKALAALERHPSMPVDAGRLRAARTFWEFDDAVTAPIHGFAGADDYYARSSSLQFLERIRVPTLLHSAIDDPFVPPEVLERVAAAARRNAALECRFTARGGHVGWIAGPPWAPQYEMEPRVTSWLQSR